jgi:hypothetical protein
MVLTTILTTIWACPPKYMCKSLNFKENWTSEDICGHAADVWGSSAMSSCLARHHRDDLAIADDLVLPMNA